MSPSATFFFTLHLILCVRGFRCFCCLFANGIVGISWHFWSELHESTVIRRTTRRETLFHRHLCSNLKTTDEGRLVVDSNLSLLVSPITLGWFFFALKPYTEECSRLGLRFFFRLASWLELSLAKFGFVALGCTYMYLTCPDDERLLENNSSWKRWFCGSWIELRKPH